MRPTTIPTTSRSTKLFMNAVKRETGERQVWRHLM
jgi:hypothetical protein